MRFARRVLAAALAASLAAAAPAAPITTLLDELRTFMQARSDLIAADEVTDPLGERARLATALAAFEGRSKSLDGDILIFQRMALPVEAFYTDDSTPIRAQLGYAFGSLDAAVRTERDALAARVASLVAPKLLADAQSGLAAADSALTSAETSATPSVRAEFLRTALRSVLTTSARVVRGTACRGAPARPGRGYFSCLLDDAPFVPAFGSGRVTLESGAPSEITLTGYGGAAGRGGIAISWSTGAFDGPGTYELDGTSGALVVVVEAGTTYYSESGQVTVTTFDAALRRVTGTFSGTLTSTAGATRRVTNGSFTVCRFATAGT